MLISTTDVYLHFKVLELMKIRAVIHMRYL